MKKRVGILLLVVLFVAVIYALSRPREPQFEGRPLTAWLPFLPQGSELDFYRTNSFEADARPGVLDIGLSAAAREQFRESKRALQALEAMGSGAVPYLVRMLQGTRSAKTRALAFLRRHTASVFAWFLPRRQPFDPDRAAINALRLLGPKARAALPLMLSDMNSPDSGVRAQARSVLERILDEHDDLTPIRQLLTNPPTRLEAVRILTGATPGAISAEEFAKWLNDPDIHIRVPALAAVSRLGPRATMVLPQLAQLSREPDPSVRVWTIEALGALGAPAVDTLCGMFTMPDNPDQSHVDILRELVKPEGNRARALGLIEQYDRQDSNAVPALVEILVDRSAREVLRSSALLQALDATSKSTTPALLRLTKHRNEYMRAKACLALRLMKGDPEPIVPALIQALNDPECVVRCNAVDALGAYGSNAVAAAAKLRAMQTATNAVERACVRKALAQVGAN